MSDGTDGPIGAYDTAKVERGQTILRELHDRDDGDGAELTTSEVHELLDGEVSKQTCREYMDELAELDGVSILGSDVGGWGGGSVEQRLRFDSDN